MSFAKVILGSLDAIIESKLWPDKKPSEIFNILMYVNSKGWLYTPTVDGNVEAILCAYRIPEVSKDTLNKMPLEDSGKILYVPFVLALNKKINLFHIVRESCKIYLEEHPDIEEIVLEDKNQKVKRYAIKGVSNGKK